MLTTLRKVERTPSDAAARLIVVPANIDQGAQFEGEVRQTEKAVIAFDHGTAESEAGGNAERRSRHHDDHHELHVMQHEPCGRKPERLQRGDLLALRGHHPPERDIEQER